VEYQVPLCPTGITDLPSRRKENAPRVWGRIRCRCPTLSRVEAHDSKNVMFGGRNRWFIRIIRYLYSCRFYLVFLTPLSFPLSTETV